MIRGETEVAPIVAASHADAPTPSRLGTPGATPTTAASQVAGAQLRVLVPRRPPPHHLSGTIIGRARTHLAASAPAKRTAPARVRRGAAVRNKGHMSDLRRQEPAADPAVTVVFWSKDRGFQLREALASLRRHARFGVRPAALRVVVLLRAAAARRAA